MKSHRSKMKAALLSECISLFDEVYNNGEISSDLGSPPDKMVIHFGVSEFQERMLDWKLQKDSIDTFVYSEGECRPAPMSRMPFRRKHGMYFDEASVDAGYNGHGKARITIVFGPLYARCFEYDVIDDGDSCELVNGVLLWLS